ncbi:hypothetical protein ACWDLG_34540 [Nonomuraea sp. NPDC003727]
MIISVSFVVILGAVVLLCLRYGRLNPLQALASVLFGFLLAQTAYAPEVRRVLQAIFHVLFGT